MSKPNRSSIRLRWVFLLFPLLCGGCQSISEGQQKEKMATALGPYIGRPISDFVIAKGAPKSAITLSPGEQMFTWEFFGESPGIAMIMPGTNMIVSRPAETISCRVSFVEKSDKQTPSLSDWTITRWTWSGAC